MLKLFSVLMIILCGLAYGHTEELSFEIGKKRFDNWNENDFIKAFENSWWSWNSDSNKANSHSFSPANKYYRFDRLMELEGILSGRILGQEEAVKITANSLISYYAGVHDPLKPIASLLFFGPTGVGKTELVKALANEFLVNPAVQFIHFSMSEFVSPESVYRLIGLPIGFVGFEKGGELTNAVNAHPYSIILLDEFEKAHPSVQKLFLQILDEGQMTTALYQTINFCNCVLIATTNLGSEAAQYIDEAGYEEVLHLAEPILMKGFSPELYNRLEPVLFKCLSMEVFKDIVKSKLSQITQRLSINSGIDLLFDQSVIGYLEINGYNPKLGARHLNRLVAKELTPSIAKALIKEKYQKGDKMHVKYETSRFIIKKI